MTDEFASVWSYRLKWLYLLLLVATLLVPVFYNFYISFNEFGFGAYNYAFTLQWYRVVFEDQLLMKAFGWTMLLAFCTVITAVPLGLIAAKFFKTTQYKVWFVALMLLPLFVPSDIVASALLVFFKNLSFSLTWVANRTGMAWLDGWFDLGFMTALIGLIIYTIPYIFIVILITMGRYHSQQTEAARSCGATAWQAFRDVEFPQIRAGIFSATAFTIILSYNEYTRTSMLKGGFDTFTSVLISQMLNTGMSEQSYAMGGIVSFVAILTIGGIIAFTMVRVQKLDRAAQLKTKPDMSG
jgi:spermidine/putrescine transport system permease protein